MSESKQVPSTGTVLATLIGVTWRRLFRGRALWVSVVIALLPVVLAAVVGGGGHFEAVNVVQFLVMALLPPMFIASSLGEEIEDRTTTYLWSRPIARWTIVIGKLIALAPLATFLVAAGLILSMQVGADAESPARAIVAIIAGSLAVSSMAAGIATLVPRFGMALAIVLVVIFDIPLAAIPASIHNLSITRHVLTISDTESGMIQPAIALAVIASIWLAVALWKIRRLES